MDEVKIQKLKNQIFDLIEGKPELAKYNYMVQCRLENCKTMEEKLQFFKEQAAIKGEELRQASDKLLTIVADIMKREK